MNQAASTGQLKLPRQLALALLLSVGGLGQASAHDHGAGAMQGHWMAPAKAAQRKNPVPASPASAARGRALFGQHCSGCHGPSGRGGGEAAAVLNPKPADLSAMSAHHSDGDLAWKIAHGKGAMPAWGRTLKPKQVWDLVNFIRSLSQPISKPPLP